MYLPIICVPRGGAIQPGLPIREPNDLIVRDPLAELLGKTLVEDGIIATASMWTALPKPVMHVAT
jgi:hypothetical protein